MGLVTVIVTRLPVHGFHVRQYRCKFLAGDFLEDLASQHTGRFTRSRNGKIDDFFLATGQFGHVGRLHQKQAENTVGQMICHLDKLLRAVLAVVFNSVDEIFRAVHQRRVCGNRHHILHCYVLACSVCPGRPSGSRSSWP